VLIALPAPLVAAPRTAAFKIEEATIQDIQSAILKGQITSTGVVKMYLARIKAYDGTCVNQPDGVLGPFTTIKHAGQVNALTTVNLRPAARAAYGLGPRKARKHDRRRPTTTRTCRTRSKSPRSRTRTSR